MTTPYSFPLSSEHEAFCRERWGWTLGNMRALAARPNGLPLRQLPARTGDSDKAKHGVRYLVVVHLVDEWVAGLPTKAGHLQNSDEASSGAEEPTPIRSARTSRSRVLRNLEGASR